MITIEQMKEYTEKLFSTMWVQWIHEGRAPAESSFEKSENILIGEISRT